MCFHKIKKIRQKKWVVISILGFVLFVSTVMIGPIMSNVETPKYTVALSEGPIEIRQYAPMIVAEVVLKGHRTDVIGSGFRMLADYIFGNNAAKKSISMTAPVQQMMCDDAWCISFVMPSAHRLENLPSPNNRDVKIKEIPQKTFITIQFSGTNANSTITKYENQLREYIKQHDVEIIGGPKYAFYNPPWTLPFMRRNEIMFEVKHETIP